MPLKVDHAKLKRVLAASRQMATFLPTADLAQGVLALRFDPFGIDSSEVCQFEELDGTRCVLRVNHEALDNAARAVPDGRDDQRGN